jgi:hypothetical protein
VSLVQAGLFDFGQTGFATQTTILVFAFPAVGGHFLHFGFHDNHNVSFLPVCPVGQAFS